MINKFNKSNHPGNNTNKTFRLSNELKTLKRKKKLIITQNYFSLFFVTDKH